MIKENEFRVELACGALKVSKSGYYKWLKQGENQKKAVDSRENPSMS